MDRDQAANVFWKQMSFPSASSLDARYKSDRLTQQTYRETSMEEMEWSASCVDDSNLSLTSLPVHHETTKMNISISPSSLFFGLTISDVPTWSSPSARPRILHEKCSLSATFPAFFTATTPQTTDVVRRNIPSFTRKSQSEENGGMPISSDFSMLSEPILNLEERKSKKKNEEEIVKSVNYSSKDRFFRLSSVTMTLVFIVLLAGISFQYFYSTRDVCSLNIDLTSVHRELVKRVHGQHLAVQVVMETFESFLKIDVQSESRRSNILVLSFQGWSGIGKNHMSGIISSFFRPTKVHKFIVTLHFAHNSEDDVSNLNDWFLSNVTSSCGIHLFIFDEVDKSSDRLVSGLRETLIAADDLLSRRNDTKAIVLLLSNSAGSMINACTVEALQEGIARENISYEAIIKRFDDLSKDSMWYDAMLRENLINRIVPFLPLERIHIEKCIIAALEERGLTSSDDIIRAVIDRLTFFPSSTNIFCKTGCRKVETQLDLLIF